MHTKKSAAIAEYVLEKLSWHDSGEVTIERELMGTKPVIEATRQTVEDSLDNEEDSDLEIEKISSIADYVLEKISRKMVREDGKFKSFLKKKKKRQ